MASWNDKYLGDRLDKCPVCLCNLNKKKMTSHVNDCFERNKAQMDQLGVIRCPMSNEHIFPVQFLNHHLEGNCQEVQNQLRSYYQGAMNLRNYPGAPPGYLSEISDEFLNQHNRDLLYLLHHKLFGGLIEGRSRSEQLAINSGHQQRAARSHDDDVD